MKKEQVLQMMGLETLPQSSNSPVGRCIALVERAGGDRDYVIFQSGGIVADKGAKSAVRQLVEYYPVIKEKKVAVVEEKAAEVKEVPVEVTPEPVPIYSRKDAIEFLVSKGMSEAKMKFKSEDELKKLLKVYGR